MYNPYALLIMHRMAEAKTSAIAAWPQLTTFNGYIMHWIAEAKASAIAAWPQSYTTYSELCVTSTLWVGPVEKHSHT